MSRLVSRLVVSVHDVAPVTAAETRRWCADLDARGVPATLLVVPGPWRSPALSADPAFAAWLRDRAAAGDELAQHGWTHRADVHSGRIGTRLAARLAARGAAEFAGLTESEAMARLLAGRSELAALGLVAPGFTPPGWLASAGTVRALRTLGFRYTTSHGGIRDLVTGGWHPAFALSHRPAGVGEQLGAWLMVTGARYAVRTGRDVRIALHPADLARPGLRTAALRAIDDCLERGARPLTYLGLLADEARVAG
ncbi:MAG TPA: polysaccharide deacetylase family protein [Mycobacteriales bacterium]|nr:polysaccharide deacetylase family protein [Mycobacteriales bacterium]